jgi:hypothetical protein
MTSTSTFANPQPPQDAAPKKRTGRKILAYGAVSLTSLFIGMGIGGAGTAAPTAAGPAPTPDTVTKTVEVPGPVQTKTVEAPAPAAPAPAPAPAGPKTTISEDGTWIVGKDVAPGKYKSTGGGYYAILKDPMGDVHDVANIVTNGNPEGQAFVTLKAGQGFLTERNGAWEKVG